MKKYYYFNLLNDCFLLSETNDKYTGKIFATYESMLSFVNKNNGILVKGALY